MDFNRSEAASSRRIKELPVPWHGLTGVETAPMSDKQTEYMLNLLIMEKEADAEKQGNIHEGMLKFPPYAVLHSRIEAAGVLDRMSVPLMIFCAAISERMGDAVMWAYTLNYMLIAEGVPKLTFDHFVQWFPWGVPTEKGKETVWDAQKDHRISPTAKQPFGNWVDNFDNWPKG